VVAGGVIGARAGHPFLGEMMRRFPAHPDQLDPKVAHGPRMISEALFARGLQGYSPRAVTVGGVTVLPKETFYPYFYREQFHRDRLTADTYAVHHWAKRW
jgi:hypothetical protein